MGNWVEAGFLGGWSVYTVPSNAPAGNAQDPAFGGSSVLDSLEQVGCRPTVHMDACLGHSAIGHQSGFTAFERREAATSLLVRITGPGSKGQKARKRKLAERASLARTSRVIGRTSTRVE